MKYRNTVLQWDQRGACESCSFIIVIFGEIMTKRDGILNHDYPTKLLYNLTAKSVNERLASVMTGHLCPKRKAL
jgi:hypothetical protein